MIRPVLRLFPVLLALAACQPATQAVVTAPRAPRAARPAPPPGRVEGTWSFGVAGNRCTAQVTHREATLSITAGPRKSITLSLSSPGRRPPGRGRLLFRGDDGNWEAPARGTGRAAIASIPLDDTGEGHVRELLGGGTLSMQGGELPTLGVPDAGVSGRDWYGCVSRLARSGTEPSA